MSKYRIDIVGQSKLINTLHLVWLLILLASVWSWKQDIMTQQTLVQAGLSVILCGLFVRHFRAKKPREQSMSILLDETGDMKMLPEDGAQWQISQLSKLAGPFLYLHIKDRFAPNQGMGKWVARDQFAENDFRRLCRVVCRCQRSQKMITK